jgi:hypothetical protein
MNPLSSSVQKAEKNLEKIKALEGSDNALAAIQKSLGAYYGSQSSVMKQLDSIRTTLAIEADPPHAGD